MMPELTLPGLSRIVPQFNLTSFFSVQCIFTDDCLGLDLIQSQEMRLTNKNYDSDHLEMRRCTHLRALVRSSRTGHHEPQTHHQVTSSLYGFVLKVSVWSQLSVNAPNFFTDFSLMTFARYPHQVLQDFIASGP